MGGLDNCCGKYPVVYMPMWIGNKQIDESLDFSIQCDECKREVHGDTPEKAKCNWNSIDVVKERKS